MGILFDEQSCSPCVKPNKISNHRVAETLMHYTRMINFREKWIFVAGAFCEAIRDLAEKGC